jgi:hypothetical protein
MKSQTFTREFEGRLLLTGGSDARVVVCGDEAPLIRALKSRARRGGIEKFPEQVRDFGTPQQVGTSQLESRMPSRRVGGWLVLQARIYFLHPRARSRRPTPPPLSRIKMNPAASVVDRDTSSMLSRESRPVSNRFIMIPAPATRARPAVSQSSPARPRDTESVSRVNYH